MLFVFEGSQRLRNCLKKVGRVLEIWRYPVSSVGGEIVQTALLTSVGIQGDRQFALIDQKTGLPAAPEKDLRWRKALHLRARYTQDAVLPRLILPDKQCYSIDDPSVGEQLSRYFNFEAGVAAYGFNPSAPVLPLAQPRYHPLPVHLVTTASLRQLAALRGGATFDRRRFRPTILVEVSNTGGFLEDEWIGQSLRVGDTQLTVQESTTRCGMTFASQPGLEEDPEILRTIVRQNKRKLGIYCTVSKPGTLNVGDELWL